MNPRAVKQHHPLFKFVPLNKYGLLGSYKSMPFSRLYKHLNSNRHARPTFSQKVKCIYPYKVLSVISSIVNENLKRSFRYVRTC